MVSIPQPLPVPSRALQTPHVSVALPVAVIQDSNLHLERLKSTPGRLVMVQRLGVVEGYMEREWALMALGGEPFPRFIPDIDECEQPVEVICGKDAGCHNTKGSYYCTCKPGYRPGSGATKFSNARENTCQGKNDPASSISPSMRFESPEPFLQHTGCRALVPGLKGNNVPVPVALKQRGGVAFEP
ncbi:hypothetical protein QTO34_015461 [Cnephaeus nilssonii]|uniref:EGF-like domain-containing protein n=1 Tax=Cnephaeus nilssonii TaxID=3371016 RepID=A0AA40I546_CNENI|nr:hypothetical protein QTO34_015461 [Eptesicus nilssonii]